MKTIAQLKKEIEELDKEIHRQSPSKCPKCGVRLYSYKAIKNHVKKYKHYGNYNKFAHLPPQSTGYIFREYEETNIKLKTLQNVCEEIEKEIKFKESDDYKMQGDNKYDELNRQRTINCLKNLLKKFQGDE